MVLNPVLMTQKYYEGVFEACNLTWGSFGPSSSSCRNTLLEIEDEWITARVYDLF